MDYKDNGRHILAKKYPSPGTLDHVASDQSLLTGEGDIVFSGHISTEIAKEIEFLSKLLKTIVEQDKKYLLRPITDVPETLHMPLVNNPSKESLVVVDPFLAQETGIIPVAAYWQSGWGNALPFVAMRSGVYERLLNVVKVLRNIDPSLSIVVMDAWRSLDQQKELYDLFYPQGYKEGDPLYVSEPQFDDALAAPHPSGGGVDVFIAHEMKAIEFGTPYDYMKEEAATSFFETDRDGAFIPYSDLIRDLRRLLVNSMKEQGFEIIDSEWWHFEYGTRRWAHKTGQEPIYGNAQLEPEAYAGIQPVDVAPYSSRAAMVNGPIPLASTLIERLTRHRSIGNL